MKSDSTATVAEPALPIGLDRDGATQNVPDTGVSVASGKSPLEDVMMLIF